MKFKVGDCVITKVCIHGTRPHGRAGTECTIVAVDPEDPRGIFYETDIPYQGPGPFIHWWGCANCFEFKQMPGQHEVGEWDLCQTNDVVYEKVGVLRPDGEFTTYEGCAGEPIYMRRSESPPDLASHFTSMDPGDLPPVSERDIAAMQTVINALYGQKAARPIATREQIELVLSMRNAVVNRRAVSDAAIEAVCASADLVRESLERLAQKASEQCTCPLYDTMVKHKPGCPALKASAPLCAICDHNEAFHQVGNFTHAFTVKATGEKT